MDFHLKQHREQFFGQTGYQTRPTGVKIQTETRNNLSQPNQTQTWVVLRSDIILFSSLMQECDTSSF